MEVENSNLVIIEDLSKNKYGSNFKTLASTVLKYGDKILYRELGVLSKVGQGGGRKLKF